MLNKSAIALSFALALGTASSAFADFSYDAFDYGHREFYTAGVDAFAQAVPAERAARNGISSQTVYSVDGQVIGRDPDVNVRDQLQRNYEWLIH